jgi:hypothetical protein
MKTKSNNTDISDLEEKINALKDEYTEDILWYRGELDKQHRWNIATMIIGTIAMITFGAAIILTITLWGLVSF